MQLLLVVSAIAGGFATDVTPLEKVIIMLEDLQTECVTEGKAEAKTYDKFACFCKDMTKEKTDSIKAGQDDVETLSAAIEELNAKREKLDTVISEQEAIIEEVEKAMAEAE